MAIAQYDKKLLLGLYSLARNYYLCGFLDEAENICNGLISIDQDVTHAKLLLAAIQYEKGNFSLAANLFRSASLDKDFVNHGRIGILLCFIAQKDLQRGRSLAEEIDKDFESFSKEQKAYFEDIIKQI